MASTTAVGSAARLGGILALADRSERFRDLAERLEDRRSTKIADATAGARAFAWASLVEVSRRTVVVVAPSEDRARRWRAELAAWLGEERVLSFPERETMPFEIGSASAGAVSCPGIDVARMSGFTHSRQTAATMKAKRA